MRQRFQFNPFYTGVTAQPPDPAILAFHHSLPGYAPTPLYTLPALAAQLGVAAIYVKDESGRFGLKAFKALGASWAAHRILQSGSKLSTLTCATDGNHGRAVAWTARRLGLSAVVYVPRNCVSARQEAIRNEGAEVVVVDGTYDDAVARAASDAAARGWQPLSDTAYPGYTEIPGWVMEGYSTLFVEADQQIRAQCLRRPNTVALQAGVGGLACAGVRHYGRDAYLIVVEPVESDCCMTSICSPDGQPQPSAGRQDSLMAGLNAGMPSLAAWPDLRRGVNCFLTIEDHWAEEAMRALSAGDPQIRAGEAGAAGLAGLLALCQDPAFAAAKERLALHRDSCIMLIVSEGDTDPASFARICRTPSPVT